MQTTKNAESQRDSRRRPRGSHAEDGLLVESHMAAAEAAAEAVLEALRSGDRARPGLSAAMASYRSSLISLAEFLPGLEMWEIEREVLPDEIRNRRIRLYGLPETTIPFSLADCWGNDLLEARLAKIPPNGVSTFFTKVIARMLDRYVSSSFPLSEISGFYRGAVEELSAIRGQAGVYEEAVVRQARLLASLALPAPSSANDNLLKTSLHKRICTETGVPLADTDNAGARFLRGRRPNPKPLPPSVASRSAILLDAAVIARSIAASRGWPAFDEFRERRRTPGPATREELLSHMSFAVRTGKPTMRYHRDMPGIEFSDAQCEVAAMLAVEAQRALEPGAPAGIPLPSDVEITVDSLKSRPDFVSACRDADRGAQMRITLEELLVRLRMESPGPLAEGEDALERAADDVMLARGMVDEFLAIKSRPLSERENALQSVKRMLAFSGTVQMSDFSAYALALAVIDERRAMVSAPPAEAPPAEAPPIEEPEAAAEPVAEAAADASAAVELPEAEPEVAPPAAAEAAEDAETYEDIPLDFEGFDEAVTEPEIALPPAALAEPAVKIVPEEPEEAPPPPSEDAPTQPDVALAAPAEPAAEAAQAQPGADDDAAVQELYELAEAAIEGGVPPYEEISVEMGEPEVPFAPAAEAADWAASAIPVAEVGPEEPVAAPEPAAPAEAQAPAETAVPAPAPQEQKLPKFDFPFANDPLDAALEPHLPPRNNADGTTNKRNALVRRVARALIWYARAGYADESIDARCLDAVKSLRISYSYPDTVAFADAIVDERPISSPALERAREIRSQLLVPEQKLLMEALQAKSWDETAVAAFTGMHPGVREMRLRQFIASRWTDGGWSKDMRYYSDAKDSLYSKCGFAPPTAEQMREAALEPSNLSAQQRDIAATFFNIQPEQLTSQHMEALGVWLSSDPQNMGGREALRAYWEAHYPDPMKIVALARKAVVPTSRFTQEELDQLASIYGKEKVTREDFADVSPVIAHARYFVSKSGIWHSASREERTLLWRRGIIDLMTAGSLAHKLRFSGASLSEDEKVLASGICTEEDKEAAIRTALTSHTSGGKFRPELTSLALRGDAIGVPSLLMAARREAEFYAMAEFLGARIERATGTVAAASRQDGFVRTANGAGRPKYEEREDTDPQTGKKSKTVSDSYNAWSEDNLSSAIIALPGGERVLLDAVFDGMGGMSQGENGNGRKNDGRTNGEVASTLVREMFEIYAAAGWLREPEDVRRFILAADLAVAMEQISRSTESARNNMGTTATIAMQKGAELHIIHCGDSDGFVLRGNETAFETEGHSMEQDFRLMARREITEAWRAQGHEPKDAFRNERGWKAEFDAQVEQRMSELLEKARQLSPGFKLMKNAIASAIGHGAQHVHINNDVDGYEPLTLRHGDLVVLCSDGITVPLCAHEIRMHAQQSGGNLASARDAVLDEADARRHTGAAVTPLCGCSGHYEKNDDKTMIIRGADEALPAMKAPVQKKTMPLPEQAAPLPAEAEAAPQSGMDRLKSGIISDPGGFSGTKQYASILKRCNSPDTQRDAVRRVLETFVSAGEDAGPDTSKQAYTLAISTVFRVASKRADRDELLDDMVPALASWSGLIMKKLSEAPDASPCRKAMFDFVVRCVEPEMLDMLLKSRNPEVASWAREAMGVEPEAPSTRPVPKSIFHSQTDESGNALDSQATRYIDRILVDLYSSSVVQDMAASMGILPRDLEIMVFYAYSGFRRKVSMDPHLTPEGQELVSLIPMHLSTRDAERILLSSYYIYRLRDEAPEPGDAEEMARGLLTQVQGMDSEAPYSIMFHDLAYQLAESRNK